MNVTPAPEGTGCEWCDRPATVAVWMDRAPMAFKVYGCDIHQAIAEKTAKAARSAENDSIVDDIQPV